MKVWKIYCLTLVFFAFFLEAKAQDLVSNFSFEEYSDCPNNEDQVEYAIGWSKFSESSTTPDYFNSCEVTGSFSVPENLFCYQSASRNCGAYIGLLTFWSSIDYREFAGIKLKQPLVVGQTYYLSFKVVMGENHLGGDQFGMPCNNIGLRLSSIPFDHNTPCPVNNFSHLRSTAVNSDSVNWQTVYGSIVADSAYEYLIAGNFYQDIYTDTIHYNCSNCYNLYSYYLIDDICVSSDSSYCYSGIDALSCDVSLDQNFDESLVYFPNPVDDFVSFGVKEPFIGFIDFFNAVGEKVLRKTVNYESQIELNISSLPDGVYFVKFLNISEVEIASNKIIKL